MVRDDIALALLFAVVAAIGIEAVKPVVQEARAQVEESWRKIESCDKQWNCDTWLAPPLP